MAELYGYDSVDYNRIPKSAKVVFPYADGRYAWVSRAKKLFPKAHIRAITVTGEWEHASIIDVEPGTVWPPSDGRLRRFVENRWRLHHDATVYCFRAAIPEVKSALHGLDYKLFLSTLDGSKPRTFDGLHCSAVQFYNAPNQAYDRSIIYDVNWAMHKHDKPEWWKK